MSAILPHSSSPGRTAGAAPVAADPPSDAVRHAGFVRSGAKGSSPSLVRSRRKRWLLACLAAITASAAGMAGFFAGDFEYVGRLVWIVLDLPVAPEALKGVRRELLDHAWGALDDAGVRWEVSLDESGRRIGILAYAAAVGQVRDAIDALAESFPNHLRRVANDAGSRPGPAEKVLIERREALEREAAGLKAEVVRAAESDPRSRSQRLQSETRERMATRRTAYQERRDRLTAVETEWAALREGPAPSEAAVDPQVRELTIVADVELQQDLKALRVQLAEMRRLLLDVASAASPALEELTAAARELSEVASGEDAQAAEGPPREIVEEVAQSVGEFETLLATFSADWTDAFKELGELNDDPRRAEAIGVHQRIADHLNGFLFQSGPPLAALRDELKSLGSDPGSQARNHALASGVTRSFHLLQSAHHRLEFVASDAKSSQNFRLDAAMKSAQGLRRRSQERLRELEARLAAQALADLKASRERLRAELESQFAALRSDVDQAIQELMTAHDQAEQMRPDYESLLWSAAELERTRRRLADIERERGDIEVNLRELADRRLASLPSHRLEVETAAVDPRPVNLAGKMFQGGLCALVALLVLTTVLFRRWPV